MNAQIVGIVLRAEDKHKTAQFYTKLGLSTNEHEHGGPKHYQVVPLGEEFVAEIYQQSASFGRDAIMIQVESIEDALSAVLEFNAHPKGETKNTPSMRFIYIIDPDGRDVMLIEKKVSNG